MDEHTLHCLDFPRIRELLAEFAQCGLGKHLAGHIQPAARLALVQRWHAQVRELRDWAAQHDLPPFAGVRDIRDVVARCAPPLSVNVEDIATTGQTLAGASAIRAYLKNLPESAVELIHQRDRIGDYTTVVDRIQRVIDERGQVRDDASPKLQRIRREIAEVHGQIRVAVDRLLDDPALRRLLQFANVTYFNDRLVLPLRTECRGRLQGIVHRVSDSGQTLYVEPSAAVELNNRISNLRSEEAEEINRLLWELAHEIHINKDSILQTLEALAVLDLLAAKVRFARAFGLRIPELAEGPLVNAREARHPLLIDLNRRRGPGDPPLEIVPISYRLGDDFDVLVITGPNTGGKTVTLKTVGLLCLMAQAGLPVPVAEGSTFGMFRRVLIDIGDEQSMQQSLSTFSAHLKRQLDMIQKAGADTLLLLDELGAGTDPDEGAALGWAILEDLRQRGCKCIVTTHLGALKAFPLARERAENACVDFDVESLRPLYTLKIGEPGLSNAIAIAERLGLPKRLVQAARNNLSTGTRQINSMLAHTVRAKQKAETARQAAESARLEAGKAEQAARSSHQLLERQRRDFESWVQRVVHLQPGDPVRVRGFDRDGKIVRMRLDVQRAEVDVGAFAVEVPLGDVLPPQTPPPPPKAEPVRPPEQRTARQQGRTVKFRPGGAPQPAAANAPAPRGNDRRPRDGRPQHGRHDAQRPRPPEPHVETLNEAEALALEPGQSVYVKRFHREGVVVRLAQAKREAVISLGLLEVEVPFSGLARRPGAAPKPRPAPAVVHRASPPAPPPPPSPEAVAAPPVDPS